MCCKINGSNGLGQGKSMGDQAGKIHFSAEDQPDILLL
jgi:hypothetical protein